ncbi:MAG: hypothetical protein HZA35_03460 [Parcubacteria group bacterium]|nr:hypothetical protein [Parcubacteria group bacterium]
MAGETIAENHHYYDQHPVIQVHVRGRLASIVSSNEEVYGRRLKPGEVIEADDVYDSTSGQWEKAPCPGLVLQEGNETVWVRPSGTT